MTSPSGHNLNPEKAQEAPSSKDPTLDIVDIRSELPDIVDRYSKSETWHFLVIIYTSSSE